MTPRYREALAALDAGDVTALAALLRQHPDLVRERAGSDEPPYGGYFTRPTLLHHVAGNPIRSPVPENIVEVATVLLEAGAEVDVSTDNGHWGWTTLGLVASGCQLEIRRLAEDMIDTLIIAGADINWGNSMAMYGATFHVVEHRGQRDVAEMLYERASNVDLCFASALGKVDRMEAFFNGDGTLTTDAYGLYRPPDNRIEPRDDRRILEEAFVFACANARYEAVDFLLNRGVDIDCVTSIHGERLTGLHAATWAGWPDMVETLMRRGANFNKREEVHEATPVAWADYLGRSDVLDRYLGNPDVATQLNLFDAVELGVTDRVRALLGDGDPDRQVGPAEPGALLRAAANRGHVDLVRFLVERGADPSLSNGEGKTAVDYAAEQGHETVVKILRGEDRD